MTNYKINIRKVTVCMTFGRDYIMRSHHPEKFYHKKH